MFEAIGTRDSNHACVQRKFGQQTSSPGRVFVKRIPTIENRYYSSTQPFSSRRGGARRAAERKTACNVRDISTQTQTVHRGRFLRGTSAGRAAYSGRTYGTWLHQEREGLLEAPRRNLTRHNRSYFPERVSVGTRRTIQETVTHWRH